MRGLHGECVGYTIGIDLHVRSAFLIRPGYPAGACFADWRDNIKSGAAACGHDLISGLVRNPMDPYISMQPCRRNPLREAYQ